MIARGRMVEVLMLRTSLFVNGSSEPSLFFQAGYLPGQRMHVEVVYSALASIFRWLHAKKGGCNSCKQLA